jgi:uncharacterized protein (DUF1697 family)
MPTYVALLRSVNVAGHGRLAMADLKESFRALGYEDVATFIQTGNVIFSTSKKSPAKLIAEIEQQLVHDFGNSPAVILRTPAELQSVFAHSPYPPQGADPARHHVTFMATDPDPKRLAEFSPPASGRDELVIRGREIYVHTPDGYHQTKLTGTMLERRLGVVTTTRNWNTVSKLCALLAG